jgi:hypothetical protein
MAVTAARWTTGPTGLPFRVDFHVLEPATAAAPDRVTPDLRPFLILSQDGGAGDVPGNAPPAGFAVSFETAFAFTMATHGVNMNAMTGAVTVKRRVVGQVPRNFIVEALVKTNPGNVVLFRVPIRFHIHHELASVRLTPDPLTTREGASPRYAIHGLFHDGNPANITVGNISGDVATWRILAGPFVVSGGDRIVPAVPAPPVGAVGTVEVRLSGAFDNRTGTGAVRHDEAFALPRAAKLIRGPGAARMAEVQNLLFLPEGFQRGASGQLAFEAIADQIVSEAAASSFTSPFKHVLNSGRMNVFAARRTPSPAW